MVTGVANFLTFGTYPACYIEKALGKILLTIVSLTLGVAQMKSNKPGLGIFEKPIKTIPIFLSVLAQTIARIFAIRSLILIKSSLGYWKYAAFFIPHFVAVFLIKIFFETKSIKDKLKAKLGNQTPCEKGKSVTKSGRASFWNLIKFIASGISSTIVMIHLHEDRPTCRKSHLSFLSHTLFFLLIFIENVLILVCLPFMASHLYPPLDCFTAASRYNAVWVVLGLWVAGVLAQVVHYKWSHPWAKLNGPRAAGAGELEFTHKLAWKPRVRRVSVKHIKYKKICIKCEDFR